MKTEYGAETKKAIYNFPFGGGKVPENYIFSILEIKKAAALANRDVGSLSRAKAQAISKVCDGLMVWLPLKEFPLPVFQGGAGTSTHMNINEVIASKASKILGKLVHPNDDVNFAQSTNDVIPSALKITSYRLGLQVISAVNMLISSFNNLGKKYGTVLKVARTHLQDALPITVGAEFVSYGATLERDVSWLKQSLEYLLDLNLGGNAIGTAINSRPKFISRLYSHLRIITKLVVKPSTNLMSQTSSQTDFVRVMDALTALTLDCSKIANDLRIAASGPKAGLGEIILPELQKGSSIMPGKVNPVLLEAMNQLHFLVTGNAITIAQAAHASQFELGVMLPVIIARLTESFQRTTEVLTQVNKRCIQKIKVNKDRCKILLESSTAYATLLTPVLGYDKTSELVKKSLAKGKLLKQILIEEKIMDAKEFDSLVKKYIQSLSKKLQ